jgi:hypothetical protein
MRAKITPEEAQCFFSPVSPFPYIGKLRGTGKKMLAVTGMYDPTFWRELTDEFLDALRSEGVSCEVLRLPCGHYSLGEPPFSYITGFRFGEFFFHALS